jgi:CHASE1-domain containing sensor protein
MDAGAWEFEAGEAPQPRATLFRGRRAAAVVLVLGLVLTALVIWSLDRAIAARERVRFENAVGRAEATITAKLAAYISLLDGAAAYVAANQGAVTRKQFRTYALGLHLASRYRGVQGVGFSQLVVPGEAAAIEARERGEGYPDFRIWPEPVPAQPFRTAILYLEPMDRRNAAAIGYDMASDPVRAAAMTRARRTGLPTASGRVELVQEIDADKQAGFLIYTPAYRSLEAEGRGAPPDLVGFVYSPFRAGDLLSDVFAGENTPRVSLQVFDEAVAPGRLLYASRAAAPHEPRLTTVRPMKVAGRTWMIRYASEPVLESGSGREVLVLALLIGALMTFILCSMLIALERRATRTALALDAQRRQDQRLRDLINELNHRVKNNLTAVQSIAARTLRPEVCGPDRERFESRLMALSRAHRLIADARWDAVSLGELVEAQLSAASPGERTRITVAGDAVALEPAEASALGLAVHELLMNAQEHGALAQPNGRVAVSWTLSPGPSGQDLDFAWREQGAGAVRSARKGFGTRVLQRGLAHELRARVELAFGREGLRYLARIPLRRMQGERAA